MPKIKHQPLNPPPLLKGHMDLTRGASPGIYTGKVVYLCTYYIAIKTPIYDY